MTVAEVEPEIIVEALDRSFKLEDFSLDELPDTIFKWELGGITDPLGQLISWLWDNINQALSDLSLDIWGWLTTIRDQITSSVSGFIDTLQSALETAINAVGSAIDSLSQSFDSFVTYVEGMLTTLQDAVSNVSNAVAGVITAVQSAISGAISQIQSLISSVSDFVSTVVSQISALGSSIYNYIASFGETIVSTFSGAISGLQSWISSALTTITQGLTSLGTQIATFVTNIPAIISDAISGLTEWLQTAFTTITQALTSLGTQIVTFVTDIPAIISSAINGLTEWLQTAFTTVSGALAQFGTTLTSFGQQILSIFNQIGATLTDLANQIVTGVTQTWTKVQNFLEQKYQQLVAGLQDVNTVLQGFVNPLVEIKNWLTTQIGSIISPISAIFQDPTKKLAEFGQTIWSGIVNTGKTIWGYIQGFMDWVQIAFQTAINAIVSKLLGPVQSSIGKPFKILSERIRNIPEGMGEVDIISYMAMGYSVEAAKQMAAVAVAEAAGEAAGEQEVSLEPMGLGARIRVKLGSILKTIAKYLRNIIHHSLMHSFTMIAFWTAEPTRYYIYQRLRNRLPVQLPTINEIIEYARRRMPTGKFREWFSKLKQVLALRGYADWVIEAVATEAEKLFVEITDRFGTKRKTPVSTLYDIPTASELANMMIKDIFASLDDFTKVMSMRGFYPDWAYLFYLLHYKYPSVEKLWEFYMRSRAGMLWYEPEIKEVPEIAKGIGFIPKSPKELNAETPIETLLTQVLGWTPTPPKESPTIKAAIEQYMKWQDYAPFAWINGFTADRQLQIDLMADIPQRIDARWMYKWGIINDEVVRRIVTARGFHPMWVDPITVAECMNALAEERTYVRTGIITAFKEGFSTLDDVEKRLSRLTTVKILNKDIPVKFLDGEVKLLTLRAKYDRAIDILRDYQRDLIKSYEENVITWEEVTEALAKATDGLAKGLGIQLRLDNEYYKLYEPVASSLKSLYTVRRIRYWLRYMMRTILSRFERGYISKSEIQQMVNEIADFAKMTDEEREALLEVADMLLAVFNREMIARGILRKLSRGVITVSEAKQKLKELGLEDDVIDAMIEYNAKTYTLTLSQLVSYMEYVPVSKEMLQRKIEMLGIPPDEAKLIPAYAVAREVSSEVGRLVTELITDYAKGLINEQQLRKELNDIATLWGKAKELGVEWLILSPQEREVLILLAKKRRERELAKSQS